ncbi:MAG: hypothetical protein PWQ51_1353 [Methanolobus sp.]|jgi:hypothetical protein|uniref:Uncharacterized protein n=2 Tax=Methanolobus TaxID=2220 RepID=W9DMZ9_METTI|nr:MULTISPECIES: hypothetical protein [Methanolobus]ETA67239.1 hypothetical protein MettiDRAFT_0654 [Methanolobus tindarius DSM 2278]MDK2825850.1 hypothetical protein [Methanolobus sp.]MDK2832363.1 hypothetical protein [Methanolobus sp.]MDK2939189.1 hypothetical protein [Methanolobus sp.]MDK2947965.1 hypothetical protein [Methanolobus sp.]
MMDIAIYSLVDDMVSKAGTEGVVEYWLRVGESYAERMGKEAYVGWPAFNVAMKDGRTSLTVEGDVNVQTDLAITDKDGDVIGYVYALKTCPIAPTMARFISRIGPIPDSDTDVADSYNNRVRDSAVSNYCITHQKFREVAANNITVAKQALECLHLANKGMTGEVKMVQENLSRINVDERHIKSILRSASCVFALIVKGKSAGEEIID